MDQDQELSVELKHVLWVVGRGDQLLEQGLIDGVSDCTPVGRAAYEALMATGFQPNPRIARGLLRLRCEEDGGNFESLSTLFLGYEYQRTAMDELMEALFGQ